MGECLNTPLSTYTHTHTQHAHKQHKHTQTHIHTQTHTHTLVLKSPNTYQSQFSVPTDTHTTHTHTSVLKSQNTYQVNSVYQQTQTEGLQYDILNGAKVNGFWDITQRILVVTKVSEQPIGPIFKGKQAKNT